MTYFGIGLQRESHDNKRRKKTKGNKGGAPTDLCWGWCIYIKDISVSMYCHLLHTETHIDRDWGPLCRLKLCSKGHIIRIRENTKKKKRKKERKEMVSMFMCRQEELELSRDGSHYSLSTGILPSLGARSSRRVKLRPFIISPYDRHYRFVLIIHSICLCQFSRLLDFFFICKIYF